MLFFPCFINIFGKGLQENGLECRILLLVKYELRYEVTKLRAPQAFAIITKVIIKEEFLMNKTELIAAVAEKAGLTKKDVEKTITATLETVKEVVAKGDKVQVVGFGTFEARARKEREGKNPQNGEKVVIPAATIPAFKAGKAFKDAVNVK